MSFHNELGGDLNELFGYGTLVRFKYFNVAFPGGGSYYDDNVTLTQSGSDLWISGLVFPINSKQGSFDAVLLEQGKVRQNDSRLYINGSIGTSGTFQVGIGSPPAREYSVLPEGITAWESQGTTIFKKVYLRELSLGSIV